MNDKLTVWLTVGAPASGKSTFSKVLIEGDANIIRVCPDDNRRTISGDSNNQAVSYPAFCMAKEQMTKAMGEGHHVIVDATFMHRKARKDFINIAKGQGAQVIAMVFECDKATLMARNAKRAADGGRNVAEHVIDAMLMKYQVPTEEEGFDKVTFVCKIKP